MFLTTKEKQARFRFSLLTFTFYLLLLSSNLSAQVFIKEKVEINPQGSYTSDSPTQGHTVRVDLEWTPSNVEGSIIFYDLFCTTPNSSWSGTSSNGSISFSHTKNGYEYYHIQFRFYPCTLFPYPNPHHIQGTYKIYYDGRLMRTSPFEINGYCAQGDFNSIYNTAFRPPLITKYTFNMSGGDLCYGHSSDIYIKGENTDCSNLMEIDTSLVKTIKLEILDGKEFASFYQDGLKKDTATIRYDNLNMWTFYIDDISLRADSFYNGTQPLDVIVKSNWADEIRYDTVKINPQTPTEIYVSSQQPIVVSSGGVSGVQVSSVAGYGICATELPDSVKYKAAIIRGQQLGNLVDYNNSNAGDMLINLDHYNGQRVIGFETEGKILHQPDTVIVNIETTDPNINATQAMLIIKPNDIDVQIIPETISKGDTAKVIMKKRNGDIVEDFPADKLFNVEIINGADYGLILDSLSNDTLTTFSNILQGFKIIAKDSTGIDSTKIRIKVTTEVEIAEELRIIKQKEKINSHDELKLKEDKEGETIAAWIGDPGAPILIEGFGDLVVKEDSCDEEIVVCNNFEPQKFEVTSIKPLGENIDWTWVDKDGNVLTTSTGNACKNGEKTNCDSIRLGVTYVMDQIGNYSTNTNVFRLNEDINVEVCLDNRISENKVWLFNIYGIRVPIFSEVCPNQALNCHVIDLKDGNDTTLLSQHIKSCRDFDKVMDVLDWKYTGSYYNQIKKIPLPYPIFFSIGTLAHEYTHLSQDSIYLMKFMNDNDSGLVTFRNDTLFRVSYEKYKCPEEVLLKYRKIIIQRLNGLIKHSTNLQNFYIKENGQWKFELDADVGARSTYKVIKENIIRWAKTTSWWCNNNYDCLSNQCP